MSESSAKMASSAGSGGVGGGVAVATPTDPVTAPREPVDPRKDFASRHRVKKLLETYTMTADRSLMGPDQASEDASRDLFHQKYYSSAYKLPPDVELSKTTSRDISPSEKLHENSETMPMSMMRHLDEEVPPVFMILDTFDKGKIILHSKPNRSL